MIPRDDEAVDPQESLLAELAESLDQAIADGDTLTDVSRPTLPPEILPRLQGLQACLVALNDACRIGLIGKDRSGLGDTRQFNGQGGDERSAQQSLAGRRIGRFEIVRELGRGGYGIVYLAVDTRLNRSVALKVPRPDVLANIDSRERFLREAEAAGALTHPNLVSVYEVGEDGPLCYIASAYCAGSTLASWLSRHGTPSARDAAHTVAQLADGVAFAHDHGVLHRDIKPSNVLLDVDSNSPTGRSSNEDGRLEDFIPRLTDFGLAKLLESPDERTKTGTLLGTTAYMAPEQAEGRVRDIDTRTDVYGLGVLLYELLTGRPPFRGENDADTLRQISIGEMVPPGRLRPGLSRDLEAICLKCLEHDARHRYASAADLANDLRRFLANEPTTARPTTATVRVFKWARRRPALAALIAVSTAALLVVTVGGWVAYERVRSALSVAEQSAAAQRRMSYAQNLSSAWRAWQHDDVEGVRRLLASCEPAPDEEDLREFAWHHLWALSHQESHTLTSPGAEMYRVAYTPDGMHLVAAGKDAIVRIWDTISWHLVHEIPGHDDEINDLAISPDGRWIATASDDGTVRVWDFATTACVQVLDGHGRQRVSTLGFAPDGLTLATGGADGRIVFWDVKQWLQRAALAAHARAVSHLCFSPLGDVLVSSSADHSLKLWDAETPRLLSNLEQSASVATTAFAISSDGSRMVTAAKGECHLWDLDDRKELRILCTTKDWIHGLAFCHDDQLVAITCKDGTVRVVAVKTGQTRDRFYGHTGCVWCASAGRDDRQLATGGSRGEVKIWNLADDGPEQAITEPTPVSRLAYTADSQLVFGGNAATGLRIRQGSIERQLHGTPQTLTVVGDFDGDGLRDQGTFQAGVWRLELAGEPNPALQSIQFGGPDDVPVVGDWNGDGRDDLGTFRDGQWSFDLDLSGGSAELTADYGGPSHQPVVGDWDGDGKDDLGLFALGLFELRYGLTSGPQDLTPVLGGEESVPVVGDWDGDGRDEVGVLDGNELLIDLGLSGRPAEYRVTLPDRGGRYDAQPLAQAGELDSKFGTAGVAMLPLPAESEAVKMLSQPNGALIAAGQILFPAGAVSTIIRFDADGRVDPAFGTAHTGIAELPREDTTGATDLARQTDGKLLVLSEGLRAGQSHCSLTRFASDGVLDTTFGGQGTGQAAVVFGPGICRTKGIAVQPDGKVVVVGSYQAAKDVAADFALARFTAEGRPDDTFGSAGIVIVAIGELTDSGTCVAIQNDGRILAGGYATDPAWYSAALLRLNGDGSPDTSFATGGKVMVRPASNHAYAFSMTLLPSGKIMISGVAAGASSNAMLARFEPNGRLDVSFGSQGWVIAPLGPGFGAFSHLAIDGTERIVAAGQSGSDPNPKLALFSFRSDGALETDFTAGLGEHPVLAAGMSRAWDVAIDAAGRPVIAGVAAGAQGHDFMLARFREEPLGPAEPTGTRKPWRTWPDLAGINHRLTPGLLTSVSERANAARRPMRIQSLSASPVGDLVASCSQDNGRVSVWNLRQEKKVCELAAHAGEARAAAFSPDGTLLASAGKDGVIKLWRTASWKEWATINDPPSPYRAVTFSPDGRLLASGSNAGVVVRIVDQLVEVKELDHADVAAVTFSADGGMLATAGDDRLIKVWDVATGSLRATLDGHTRPVVTLAFSPDGRTLASGAGDDSVRLWDVLTFQELAAMPNVVGALTAIAFRQDGRQLAVAGGPPGGQGELRLLSAAEAATPLGAN